MFGSASMGALRAAELHSFGMRGVGRIFEAFRDGVLEDDDEVAVVHGPAELGYLSASESMVNIRATLALAENRRRAPRRSRGGCWKRSLNPFISASEIGRPCWMAPPRTALADSELSALRDWLPAGRVDQKRLDALAMLAAMQEALAAGEAKRPAFHFEWTYLWDQFVARSVDDEAGPSPSGRAHSRRIEARRAGRLRARWKRGRCCEWSRPTAPRGPPRFRAMRRERRWLRIREPARSLSRGPISTAGCRRTISILPRWRGWSRTRRASRRCANDFLDRSGPLFSTSCGSAALMRGSPNAC